MNGTTRHSRRERQRKYALLAFNYAVALLCVLALFAMLAQPADAGGCRPCVAQQVVAHHAVAQPVVVEHVAQPAINNVFYGVGDAYTQKSQMTAALKDALAEYQFNATVNGTIQGSIQGAGVAPIQGGYQQQQGYAPPQQQPPMFSLTQPKLPQQCASCHAGDKSHGGFNAATASNEQWREAALQILTQQMPPNGGIQDIEERHKAAIEILGR